MDTYTDKETGKVKKRPKPQIRFVDTIEQYAGEEAQSDTGRVWNFFKLLRKYQARPERTDLPGLTRDQILLLTMKFGAGMSFRQIKEAMHWTSMDTVHRRFKKALVALRQRGFGDDDKK